MPSFTPLDSSLATYSFIQLQFQPAATATDVINIGGFSGTCKFRWISVSGSSTVIPSAGTAQRASSIIRRTARSTGGTSTNPLPAVVDSRDNPSGSVVSLWTVNPAGLGAGAVTMDAGTFTITNAASIQDRAIFQYELQSSKPLVLNGANDFLCVNLTGGNPTLTTDRLDFDLWWTER